MTVPTPISPLRQVLIAAYGPARVTKSACRRARTIVGNTGTVAVVAATDAGRKIVDRLGPAADLVAVGHGSDGILELLGQMADSPVLLLHDDASLEPAEAPWIFDQFDVKAGAHRLVAGDSTATVPYAVLGTPGQLADRVTMSGDVSIDGRDLPTIEADIRHDGRCGATEAAEPAPRRPLVVASLIVRDEEAHLEACLSSLEGFVDHVVICDTGSSDRTVELAVASGADVIEREWRDDFSWARNEALAAAGPAAWILWIDADERLVCLDPHAARLRLRGIDERVEALAVSVISTRTDGPTSVGIAQRLYRPADATFNGAIHEELVNVETGHPLVTERTDLVQLSHLGYAVVEESLQAKAQRNLSIARRAFEDQPTAKTAADLARSIAYAGAGLPEALAAALGGLELTTPQDPLYSRLLSMASGFQLELESYDSAFDNARAALVLDAGDDVAAAVFAQSGSRLGRDREMVEMLDTEAAATAALQVPYNRLSSLSSAVAAAGRLHNFDAGRRLMARAAALLPEVDGGWMHVAGQLVDLEPDEIIELSSALSTTQRAELVAAGYQAFPLETADRVAEPTSPQGPETGITLGEDAGITLSFGLETIPTSATAIATAVPPGRRVLEWGDNSELTAQLTEMSTELTTLDVTTPLVAQLARLAVHDRQFDVAIGGLGSSDGNPALVELKRLLDPSGQAMLWDLDEAGVAVNGFVEGTGHTLSGPDREMRSARAGYTIDPSAPNSVTLLRPMIDESSHIGSNEPSDPSGHLHVASSEPLSHEMQLAYRLSLPSTIRLTFGGVDPSPSATATLITDQDVLPDPRWVQHLWDRVLAHREPTGIRLIDQYGVCVHAGATTDGRIVGQGDPGDAPFLRTDRSGAVLLPPYIIPGALDGRPSPEALPIGRMIANSVAVTLDTDVPAAPPVRIGELFSNPVLLLDGPAPGCGYPRDQDAVDKAVRRLTEAGLTPIYKWAESTDQIDARIAQDWRTAGVVLVPPSPDRHQVSLFRPDATAPRSDALVTAIHPSVIAHLTVDSLEWDFQTIAGHAADATVIYSGPQSDRSDERADVTCSLDELADTILRITSSDGSGSSDTMRPLPAHNPQIPVIPAVATEPGVVSIVIPVHNRWDLTEACLASIEAHTPVPHEIIVVDNGSTDGTAAGLLAAGVTVVTNDRNRGFPTAVNQGILATRGEFTCVLNNDTEVTAGWIEALLNTLEVPRTAMVGPRSNRIAGFQRIPDGPAADDPAAHQWAAEWTLGREGLTWPIGRLIGFCLLLRRNTLEQLGGFDEGFGIGNYEDDELGNRILARGNDLRVADAAVVIHHGSATFAELGLDYAAVMHESSRHLQQDEPPPNRLTAAVVLSDGDSVAAAATAASALSVAEHIRIVERQALISTELAASAIRGGRIEVSSADWMTETGAATALDGLHEPRILVLGAGEFVDCDDFGRARSELEQLGDQIAEVATVSGGEVRIVPPGKRAIDAIGTSSEHRVTNLSLTAAETSER